MSITNSLSLRLGSGGGKTSFTNPAIPAVENIVRCWSLRRNVPAYKKGAGIRELRASGGSENDVLFLNSGLLLIAGDDAFANVIYDQKGNADSKLAQGTFAACPKVFESNAMLKGLYFNGDDKLSMAATDADIEAAAIGNAMSYSLWFRMNQTGVLFRSLLYRASSQAGYMVIGIADGKVRSYMRNINTPLETSQSYNDNNWHMVTVTREGGLGAANGHKLYIDGSLSVQQNVLLIQDVTSLFAIGRKDNGDFPYTGSLNDIIIWNLALDPTQVAALYAAQSPYYAGGGAK